MPEYYPIPGNVEIPLEKFRRIALTDVIVEGSKP